MKFSIACVFRESPIYTVDYLKIFKGVFNRFHPDKKLVCFTNVKDTDRLPDGIEYIPLKYEWSTNWWSKLELFRPDIDENFFYTDLDNVIIRPLDALFEQSNGNSPLMINDLDPKLNRLQSAVMYIPHKAKHLVWDSFIRNPEKEIKEAGIYGDAFIIRKYWKDVAIPYQDLLPPNTIISYRYHWLKNRSLNPSIICFHGPNDKKLISTTFKNDPFLINNFYSYI